MAWAGGAIRWSGGEPGSMVRLEGGVCGGEPGPFLSPGGGLWLLRPFSGGGELPPALALPASPTMDSMLKPIFCLGVGIMTAAAAVGTGGIILVINTAAVSSAMLAAFWG